MFRYIKKILMLLLGITIVWQADAQSRIVSDELTSTPPDSSDVAYYGHKDFAQAALSVIGMNAGVWAFDRYVQKSDYAYVSIASIKKNLKDGFKWDNDRMSNNMFLHPYHGNLYFNAGRSNGFNYWQSGLFALAGSATWELFGENEYPSTNDIIVTPIGGMAIGEVAFRASDLVLDDRTRGWNRFGHELACFVISPMRGLTRIINGDAWRHRDTPGRVFGKPLLDVEISAGVRALGYKRNVMDKSIGFTTEINIEYGDRYELRSSKPYDYFKFKMGLSLQKSQPLIDQINIIGRLVSRELIDTKNNDLSIGLYQHYDYYDSDTISEKTNKTPYNLAVPASVGVGFIYRGTDSHRNQLDAHAHINAVLMGGVLSDHWKMDDRNYNLGSGFSIKSGVNFVLNRNKFSVSVDYDYYHIFTWGYPRGTELQEEDPKTVNSEGDDSTAHFGIMDIRADWNIAKHLYLTGSFTNYLRITNYRDFANVHSSSFSTRLMLTYKF